MLVWIYFSVFLCASITSTQQGFTMGRDARIVIAETFVNALAMIGMLIYFLEPNVPFAEQWWWLVSIAITVAFLIFGVLDIRYLRSNPLPDVPEELVGQLQSFGLWVAFAIFGPAAYFNLMLGFGG